MKNLLRLFVLLLAVLALPVAVNAQSDADVNGDGEVSIADINSVVSVILSGIESEEADVNGDGEVTVADINAVIESIFNGSSIIPPTGGGLEGFSDETLALLRANGMNIYDGNEPPVIKGVYAMEPVVKIAEHGWGGWEDATVMLKMIFNLGDQSGGKILFSGGSYQMDLETEEVYVEGSNEFMLVNINGQGNKFTISYTLLSEDPDEDEYDVPWAGTIISGEKTNNGIKNLQMASVIFAIPALGLYNTAFDIYADSDGISYPCEWPEWPEDDWIKSSDPDRVKPWMMTKSLKMLKSLLENIDRNK